MFYRSKIQSEHFFQLLIHTVLVVFANCKLAWVKIERNDKNQRFRRKKERRSYFIGETRDRRSPHKCHMTEGIVMCYSARVFAACYLKN